MRASLLADRYATALGQSLAPESLEAAGHALSVLGLFYASDPEFKHALANPTHDVAARRAILDAALQANEAPEPVVKLAHTLLDRNRIALLPEVATRFDSHVDGWLNRVEATVVSAIPLEGALETRVRESLERFAGKKVRLKTKIDTNLIGGFVVYMWGVLFDVSLRTQLNRLREKLLSEEN